ncbi:MAG: hypothetical protein ACRERD_08890 [Candidatus Binatia bacterium]
MPVACSICVHGERQAIDTALVQSDSFRHVAAQYGVSTGALVRYKKNHLARAVRKAQDVAEYRSGKNLLDRVESLTDRALRISDKAEDAGEWGDAISGGREARNCLELVGKLTGELKDTDKGDTVNNYFQILALLDSPELEAEARRRGIAIDAPPVPAKE